MPGQSDLVTCVLIIDEPALFIPLSSLGRTHYFISQVSHLTVIWILLIAQRRVINHFNLHTMGFVMQTDINTHSPLHIAEGP